MLYCLYQEGHQQIIKCNHGTGRQEQLLAMILSKSTRILCRAVMFLKEIISDLCCKTIFSKLTGQGELAHFVKMKVTLACCVVMV